MGNDDISAVRVAPTPGFEVVLWEHNFAGRSLTPSRGTTTASLTNGLNDVISAIVVEVSGRR